MRIAVCDDSRIDAEHLKAGLEKTWPDTKVDIYNSAEAVLDAIEGQEDCNLIFLDIYMEGMNGIQAAEILKKRWPDTEVVFISTSREFGPEAFELNALYYLVKPYKEELLEEIRDRYRRKHAEGVVIYNSAARQKQEIPYHRILYIESARNDLYIHLINGAEIRIRHSLQNFMKELDGRFLQVNRGVTVNMDEVEKMNPDSCEIGGVVFMLSRRQKMECRRKYNDYIFRNYMEGE